MMQDPDQKRDRCGNQKTVQTIHQPAMTWNEPARIFGAEVPLDRGFE